MEDIDVLHQHTQNKLTEMEVENRKNVYNFEVNVYNFEVNVYNFEVNIYTLR